MKRKPFQRAGEIRSIRVLERVHSDVVGHCLLRKKYFVTFIDDLQSLFHAAEK